MSTPEPRGFAAKLPPRREQSNTNQNDETTQPSTPKTMAEIEAELTRDLTTNPERQYRSPQSQSLFTPYTNPIQQYSQSPFITGKFGSDASQEERRSVFSSFVANDDIDSIPPTALFLGRIGQPKPKKLERFIQSTPSQKEFFENSGFNDEMIKDTVLPSTLAAVTLAVLSTPFERARALVQADPASVAALQDANEINMIGKDLGTKAAASLEASSPSPVPTVNQPTGSQPTEKKPALIPRASASASAGDKKKLQLSAMIQPERRDTFSAFFKQNPNSTRTPILRPNPYDIYARRQILTFEEEYLKVSSMPEYKTLTPMERAIKAKELNPKTLKNIRISQYDMFNHHIEHGMSQRSVGEMISGASATAGDQVRAKMRPLEPDVFPQNQSDLYRGFHRYYAEPRYTTLRSALRAIYQHNGILGTFRYSLMPAIAHAWPFLLLMVFYRPWKMWMTQSSGKSSIVDAELTLAENHSRAQILSLLFFYPLFALMTAVHVNKTTLFPNYTIAKSIELQHWKERFLQYHTQNDTFARYTMKTPGAMAKVPGGFFSKLADKFKSPEPAAQTTEEHIASVQKYPEHGDKSPLNQEYRKRQVKFLESMISRETNKSRTKMILEQQMLTDGPKSLLRAIRPASVALMAYYLTYIGTFTAVGTATVKFVHQLHSTMKPAPPQGHPHDIRLEVIKGMVPFTVATLAAQYIAYPLTTIRNYICATGSPGYVTFNANANALPYGIAVDQYRLPFREIRPIGSTQQFQIASHEIRRQYGFKGFWHGASIIPAVRLPKALVLGSAMFFSLHSQWPAMNQLVDSQHFYNVLPPLL